MRIKSVIGTLVAFGAAALAAVSVQAATYSVTTSVSDSTVTMTVNIGPDEGETSVDVNAYALQVGYDSTVLEPVAVTDDDGETVTDETGATMYATNLLTDDDGNALGVMTADLVTGAVAVGWANDEAVTLTKTTGVAEITFTVLKATNTTVTVNVISLAKSSSEFDTNNINSSAEEASGTITLSSSYLKGDANVDGEVTEEDTLYVLRHASGNKLLTGQGLENANVDGDDDVTEEDAVYILRHASGNKSLTE